MPRNSAHLPRDLRAEPLSAPGPALEKVGLKPIKMADSDRPNDGTEQANIPQQWSEGPLASDQQLPVPFDYPNYDLSDIFIETPSLPSDSPATFHTPLSDSYILHAPPAYNVRPLPAREPPRSMSVNAATAALPIPPPRQIRFVSTDGQPHAKRRRINAACLTCRKRKTRCSGERPQCKTCIDTAHVCAGYTGRLRKGGDDKNGDSSEEEESGTSSPKKPQDANVRPSSQTPAARPVQVPKTEQARPFEVAAPDPDIKSPGSNHTASSASAARHR